MTTMKSRRAVLAGLAAAPAVALPALAASVSLETVDPIFAAIEEHKRSHTAIDVLIDQKSAMEDTIPDAKRKWYWRVGETFPPADCQDDPQWLAVESQLELAGRDQDAVVTKLLTTAPTTIAGIAALLGYVWNYRDRGDVWPDLVPVKEGGFLTRHQLSLAGRLDEEEKYVDFEVALIGSLSRTLGAAT